MFKKFKWPVLIATVFALLTPAAAMAQRRDRGARTPERHERRAFVQREHHERRHPSFSFSFGARRYPRSYFVAPYAYPNGYYTSGYYDQWGYWHPYNGYYDAWGVWHWS